MLHGAHHSFGLVEWNTRPISLSLSIFIFMIMSFSTKTEMERVGIVGLVCWLWTLDSSAKKETKRIGGGSSIASPMPKSILSGERKDQLLKE